MTRVRSVDPAAVAAILSGLGAVAVLRTTMLPTVGTWDTAEAQVVLPLMGTMHPTGFPAFVVLGWLVSVVLQPFGSPAFLMNLMAGLLVGVAVGASVLVTRRLGAPLPVAVAVGAGFALTPIVWQIGSAADAHALHLALLVLVVLALLRWESLVSRRNAAPADPRSGRAADRAVVGAAAVFGVALANHALALLLVPAIGLYVLSVEPRVLRRPRLILAALGACVGVAALLYLELPLRAGLFRAPLVYGRPDTLGGFLDIVFARQFQGSIDGPLADIGAKTGELLTVATAQFGPLVAVIPAGLLLTIVRYPRYALLSLVATAITCVFAASYANARIDRYYLGPAFFAWTWIAVFAGAVAQRMLGRDAAEGDDVASGDAADGEPDPADGEPDPAAGRAPDPGPVYLPAWRDPGNAVAIALAIALLVPTGTVLADRWREVDRSRETWVEAWLDEAFAVLAPDAVVISWWSYSTPLWYAQLVEGRRPDVWVVDDRTRLDLDLGRVTDVIDANLGRRPVYVMRLKASEIQTLAARYAIEPVGRPGNLFRVTGRQETTP